MASLKFVFDFQYSNFSFISEDKFNGISEFVTMQSLNNTACSILLIKLLVIKLFICSIIIYGKFQIPKSNVPRK